MPNNIAEGSGSCSKKEFHQFLNFARRPVFENANILIILYEKGLIDAVRKEAFVIKLDTLSRKIKSFQESLLK